VYKIKDKIKGNEDRDEGRAGQGSDRKRTRRMEMNGKVEGGRTLRASFFRVTEARG